MEVIIVQYPPLGIRLLSTFRNPSTTSVWLSLKLDKPRTANKNTMTVSKNKNVECCL